MAINYKIYTAGINYQENNFYPKKATVYLKKYYPQRRIFTAYQWGGYMVWKYPGYRGFIDGRMLSWKNKHPAEGESNDAAKEYMAIIAAKKNYQQLFDKYKIELVMLSRSEGLLKEKLEKSLIWKKVYDDKTAAIFIRK